MTSHLDGNALAGPLADLFAGDLTMAIGTCASCHDASALALAVVDLDFSGWIVTCHRCGAELLHLEAVGGRTRLDLRGLAALSAE